jgi:hypothetical protein
VKTTVEFSKINSQNILHETVREEGIAASHRRYQEYGGLGTTYPSLQLPEVITKGDAARA